MAHRIRKAFELGQPTLAGPVEVEETCIGGKRKNLSNAKRKQATGRGTAGKVAVAGAKDRSAKQYVEGQAHTNGIESFWALLKRGYRRLSPVFHSAQERLRNGSTLPTS